MAPISSSIIQPLNLAPRRDLGGLSVLVQPVSCTKAGNLPVCNNHAAPNIRGPFMRTLEKLPQADTIAVSKVKRDTELQKQRRFDAAEKRYIHAVLDFVHAASVCYGREDDSRVNVLRARPKIQNTTALAFEAAEAMVFGLPKHTLHAAEKYKIIEACMDDDRALYSTGVHSHP